MRLLSCASVSLVVALAGSARAAAPVDPVSLGQAQAFLAEYSETARAQSASFFELYSDHARVHIRADGQANELVFQGRPYKAWSRELLAQHRIAIDQVRFLDATLEQPGGRLVIRAKRYSSGRCSWDMDYQVGLEPEGGRLRIVEERLTTQPNARCEWRATPSAAPPSQTLAGLGTPPSPLRWQPLTQAELQQSALRLAEEAAARHGKSPSKPPTIPEFHATSVTGLPDQSADPAQLLVTPPYR